MTEPGDIDRRLQPVTGAELRLSGRRRPCDKCGEDRPTEGGVQLGSARWHCGHCWRGFAMKRKPTA